MPVTLATHAMGTRFELVLEGGDPHRLRAAGEAALREIEECHHRFNLFDPGSWLNSINRRAAAEPVTLDDLTFDLLETCRQVHHDSGGAFDITVAPLMRTWGFHGKPDREAIEQAKVRVGMRHVLLDRDTRAVRFAIPGVTLDLGGIAKGFAIDQAIDLLREYGVSCALLHGGTSTVAAIGAPPGEPGWRVKLHAPEVAAKDATVVCLNNQTLSVSAPHGRVVNHDGETLGHVLDPRTCHPADCGAYAAAVGGSACLTDAWATALLVLGETPAAMPDSIQAVLPDQNQPAPMLEDAYA
ncbi:MAG: FAD:protein FMN transferase [Phycisphaerales bacterium]